MHPMEILNGFPSIICEKYGCILTELGYPRIGLFIVRILVFTACYIVTVYVEFIFPFSRENCNSHERCDASLISGRTGLLQI
jgi:hypothetical protein